MRVETHEQAARMMLRTPCCGAPFHINYVYGGALYMQEQVVDGIECLAAECGNSWSVDGYPSVIRSSAPDESGFRPYFVFEEGDR